MCSSILSIPRLPTARAYDRVALAPIRDMVLLDPLIRVRGLSDRTDQSTHFGAATCIGRFARAAADYRRLTTDFQHRCNSLDLRQSWLLSRNFDFCRCRPHVISCDVRRSRRDRRERTRVIYQIRHLTDYSYDMTTASPIGVACHPTR